MEQDGSSGDSFQSNWARQMQNELESAARNSGVRTKEKQVEKENSNLIGQVKDNEKTVREEKRKDKQNYPDSYQKDNEGWKKRT